jgi:hypothetical protein
MTADHDDGNGVLPDDLAEHIEAIHPGHFQIECHDIGAQLRDFFESEQAVHGRSHYFNGRIALQQLRNQLPH